MGLVRCSRASVTGAIGEGGRAIYNQGTESVTGRYPGKYWCCFLNLIFWKVSNGQSSPQPESPQAMLTNSIHFSLYVGSRVENRWEGWLAEAFNTRWKHSSMWECPPLSVPTVCHCCPVPLFVYRELLGWNLSPFHCWSGRVRCHQCPLRNKP